MHKDEIYDKLLGKLNKNKAYWNIMLGFQGFVKQKKLTAADVVDYVIFWADNAQARMSGEGGDKTMPFMVRTTQNLINDRIRQNYFSQTTWQTCLAEMIKSYFAIAQSLPEGSEVGMKIPPIEGLRADGAPRIGLFIERPVVDGDKLSDNEAAFYDFCVARFNEEEWCKEHGIKYDAALAERLEEKYQKIGWTVDHTKFLPLPRRWQP